MNKIILFISIFIIFGGIFMITYKKESRENFPEKTFELELHQKVFYDKIQIELREIVTENIEPSSNNKDYPAGSGAIFHLLVNQSLTDSKEIILESLSGLYKSNQQINWNGYNFTLVGIVEKGTHILPKVKIVKIS